VAKYMTLEQSNEGSSMPARKSHSKGRTVRIPQSLKELISDDPEQSLRKLASIVDINEPTMRRIVEEDFRYKSYSLKIQQMFSDAARTNRVARLPFWPSRFKSFGLLRTERN